MARAALSNLYDLTTELKHKQINARQYTSGHPIHTLVDLVETLQALDQSLVLHYDKTSGKLNVYAVPNEF